MNTETENNLSFDTPVSTGQLTDIIKKKRRRPEQIIQPSPGDNAKYLKHALAIASWEKPDMTSLQDVDRRISDYFSLCMDNDMKPTIEELAAAFATDRKSLWRYANGVIKSIPSEVCHSIKKAYILINGLMVNYTLNGKINPVAGFFFLKNNNDYTDTTEVIVSPNGNIREAATQKELAEKYETIFDAEDAE